MSYLDDITELSIQAQEVISRLAVIQAERSEAGEGSPKLRDQILRFTQLLSQSLNASLTDEQRLKLLTRLVNDARLAEVPYYPYPPIEVTVVPTQRYVGDHDSLSNIQGDGFFHISAAQRSRLLSSLQPADLTFGGILGLPGDNVALAAVLAGKEPVFSPSGNAAQFLNGNKAFAVVQYSQLGGKPTTLTGFGISSSDTLFDGKYLQLGSPLAGLSTISGAQITSASTVIQAFGSLQNQVNTKEPALGNPSNNGDVLASLTDGTRYWVPFSGGGTLDSVAIASANGFAGSSINAAGVSTITLRTSVTGILKGNGTAISAATPMTDYLDTTGAADGDTILYTGGVATWSPGLFNPMDGPGQMIYGGVAGVTTKLAANATSTNKFLRSVSSGNPSWEVLSAGDIPAIDIAQVTDLSTALTNKLSTVLTDGYMYIGNAANAAVGVQMYGDATIDNSGSLLIADEAVTFAKMQNITATTLVGRWSAGDGPMQEVTIGSGLSLSMTGVLTSGGLVNPMTTIGDIIIGDTGGDPIRLAAGTNGYILTMVSGSPAWAVAASGGGNVTGPGPTVVDGNFAVYNGTGGLTIGQPSIASLDTGGNASFASLKITGTGGNGHMHLRHQASAVAGLGSSNTIYALATGSNGFGFVINNAAYASSLVFGATAARTYTLPDLTGTVALLANPAPFTSVTVGTASSLAGDVVFQNATNATTQTFRGTNPTSSIVYLLPTTAPTAGQALVSTAPSSGIATLSWSTVSGSGVNAMAAIGSAPNANGATISGTTLNLEPASASFGGVVTTGTQTIAGAKTFSGSTTFSLASGGAIILSGAGSTASAAISFTGATMRWINFGATGAAPPTITTARSLGTKLVFSNTFASGSANDFAIGLDTFSFWFTLQNNSAAYSFQWYGGASSVMQLVGNGQLTLTPVVQTSGAIKGFAFTGALNTGQSSGVEISSFGWTTTGRQWATGAIGTQREFLITAPTYSFVGASTITNAGTFVVAGAPIAGTNATITNAYALWVQDGVSLFGGNIRLTQTVTTETVVSDTTVTMVINGTTYKLLARA